MKKALVTIACSFVGALGANLLVDKIREYKIKKAMGNLAEGISDALNFEMK